MNIAVLFYGRLHNYDKHYNNIMKFLNKDNNNLYIFLSSDNEPKHKLKGFIKLYKPISYTNDKIKPNYHHNLALYESRQKEVNIDNVFRHFTNNKRVMGLYNEFIKNNNDIKIDLLVTLRLDLLIDENTKNINHYIKNKNHLSNNIYIPNIVYEGFNDQIAFGNYNVINIYMNVIDNIDFLLSKYKNCFFNPEILLLYHMKNYKVNIKKCDINYIINKN